MKVAIIGCGNIGFEIATFINNCSDFELHSLTDINLDNIEKITNKLSRKIKISNLETAIVESDLIIEASNKEVVKEILLDKNIDSKNKKLLVMSTGGLIENTGLLYRIKKCKIHVPSGAIAGLDAIRAVAGQITFLRLVTTKPPESLSGSPYINANCIKLESLKTKTTIFKGELKEAINGFPKNINIAASLFLASKFEDISIEIVANPNTRFNTHKIICKGKFGELNCKIINRPSSNPKTSYLAILSAIGVLKTMTTNLKVGY